MLYPRLASLAILLVGGLIAYAVFPSNTSLGTEFNANEMLVVLRLVTAFFFGFIAYIGFFGFMVSFAIEPGTKPGTFRIRENLPGKLLGKCPGVNNEGGYCGVTMWSGCVAFGVTCLLVLLGSYFILAFTDFAKWAALSIMISIVAGIFWGIFLISKLNARYPKLGNAPILIVLIVFVGIALVSVFLERDLVDWLELFQVLGIVTLFSIGVLALLGIRMLLKKTSVYQRFCPAMEKKP